MNTIPFTLDTESKVKLYFQLYQKMTEAISNGAYAIGTKLPSVRDLAKTLHISRNTVNTAYKMLIDAGYVHSRAKSGYLVNKVENFSSTDELLSDTIKDVPSHEETEIPTVTDVVKQCKGIEIQHIPFSKDFNDILPTESIHKKFIKSNSSTSAPQTNNQLNEPFGKKEVRKSIARYVYDIRNISCTSGQVVVAEKKSELLLKAITCFSPETKIYLNSNVFPGKGLLRLAELSVQPRAENVIHIVAFSKKAYALFQSEIPSSIQAKLFTNEEAIDIPTLDKTGATIAVIAPTYKKSKNTGNQQKNMENYDTLLTWAKQSSDRYIIECDTSSQEDVFENPLVCSDKENKILYLSSIDIGRPLPYLILPPAVLKKYRDRWNSENCSLSEQIQTLAETAIPLKLLNVESMLDK